MHFTPIEVKATPRSIIKVDLKKNDDKIKSYQVNGGSRPQEASKNCGSNKKFDAECFNCDKKGHKAKDCLSKKKTFIKTHATTSRSNEKSKDEWDTEASLAIKEEELALIVTTTEQNNYMNDWIKIAQII